MEAHDIERAMAAGDETSYDVWMAVEGSPVWADGPDYRQEACLAVALVALLAALLALYWPGRGI